MSRRSNQRYICHAIEELARQLLYAPPGRRVEDIRRAEQLHDELDPQQNYPMEFLAYRITAHRLPDPEGTTLVGEAVLPDLRLLIDSLSRSIDLPPATNEAEETTQELAERLRVSEKTIARWRRNGLRWRWVSPEDGGAKRVVIPASALERYDARHPGQAEQAATFTRMSADQRRTIIEQAKQLIERDPGLSLNQAARRLAESTGRGHETIRELLQKHDREHSGSAIFTDRDRPLDAAQHAAIERAYLAGEGAGAIARRYGRSPSTVYRVIHKCRARRALTQRYSYQASPTFEREDAAEVLLRTIAPPGPRARRPDSASLALLPEELRPAFGRALPPDRLMVALLLRYNYLKFSAAQVQDLVRSGDAKAADLDRYEALERDVFAARAGCIHAALPLVFSVCRRQESVSHADAEARLLARLMQAYPVLTTLVEAHDATRSARFESVLTNRLLRTFAQAEEAPLDPAKSVDRLLAEFSALGPMTGDD